MTIINIRRSTYENISPTDISVVYRVADELYELAVGNFQCFFNIGTLDIPNNVFPDIATGVAYFDPLAIADLKGQVDTATGVTNTPGVIFSMSPQDIYNNFNLQSDWAQSNTSALDFIKNKPTRTTSAASLSLVGTGATGTQVDANKDSTVRYTISTAATATIAGAATSKVELKICATNNVTEGSWTTVATQETDQNVTLALVLQSVTAQKGQLCADIPAGWYHKLVNSGTGTHTETFVSGQKTIYG